MFHITQPQSTSRTIPHNTTIPHHTHIQHRSIFHTTPYSTSHYTTTSDNTLHHFHIWHHTTIGTLHMPHSSPQFHTTSDIQSHQNFPHLALCNIPHTRTPHHYHTIFHITHFAFQSHVWNGKIHIAPRYTYTDITFHIKSALHGITSRHIMSTFHAMHISTFKYKFHITLSHCTTLHFNHHLTSHRHVYVSHLTLHDVTCSVTPYRTYSTSVAP